jgi:hypothetical protein
MIQSQTLRVLAACSGYRFTIFQRLRGKGTHVDFTFNVIETTFYTVMFVASSAAGFVRVLRDDGDIVLRSAIAKSLGSGCVGFGVVAIGISHFSSITVGSFYWLAVAAFIGYLGQDLQDKILNRIAEWAFKKVGMQDGAKSEDNRPD